MAASIKPGMLAEIMGDPDAAGIPPRDDSRDRAWMEIRAKSPMRARSFVPVADVNECPLFIAANEPTFF